MQPRGERQEGDAVYFIALQEVGGSAHVALGNYYAMNAAEALQRAAKDYPIFFSRDTSTRWSVRVERLEVA